MLAICKPGLDRRRERTRTSGVGAAMGQILEWDKIDSSKTWEQPSVNGAFRRTDHALELFAKAGRSGTNHNPAVP